MRYIIVIIISIIIIIIILVLKHILNNISKVGQKRSTGKLKNLTLKEWPQMSRNWLINILMFVHNMYQSYFSLDDLFVPVRFQLI